MADLEDPGGFLFKGFIIPVLGSRVIAQTVGRLQDKNLLSPIPSIALGTGRRPARGMRYPGRPLELGTIATTASWPFIVPSSPASLDTDRQHRKRMPIADRGFVQQIVPGMLHA